MKSTSGRMIKKIELNLNYSSYHKMRASLYRAMSQKLTYCIKYYRQL